MNKKGRHLAQKHRYQSLVQVILNAQGKVIRVELLGQSGKLELDQAAIKAFNKAANRLGKQALAIPF